MFDMLNGQSRTHYCGEILKSDVNNVVTVFGWVRNHRDFGGLIFVDLADITGIVQVVLNPQLLKEEFDKVSHVKNEFVLSVVGKVVMREHDTVNPKLKTGEIEIHAQEVRILNESAVLPFTFENADKVNESLRLKHRYLDLRRPELQQNLILRNNVLKVVRNYLDEQRFFEIETPILGKSTPEGARDYLVPSRTFKGSFFALPQSPQLYKQLLMISGMDRYYQIARCFRDEDLRADRQPEFTQIDLEVSFIDKEEKLMNLVEPLVREIFEKTINYKLDEKIKVITYDEAMNKYGSDKPDTRFGLEIVDISHIAKESKLHMFKDMIEMGGSVRAIVGKGLLNKMPRRDLDRLTPFVREYGAEGISWMQVDEQGVKSSLIKFFTQEQLTELLNVLNANIGDVIFIISDYKNDVVLNALGKLRLMLAEKFNLIDKDRYDVLWVTDFPMFEYSKEEKRLVAKHHPFTSPKDEDLHLLDVEPLKVRAKAYDLVVNGHELGGGSIRIYKPQMQQKMFELLGFAKERIEESFGFFVNAFNYGAPPHGGMAIGLDRLIMLLSKTSDIRQVIAFPKIQSAQDLLTLAPSVVEPKQLEELNILLDIKKEDE